MRQLPLQFHRILFYDDLGRLIQTTYPDRFSEFVNYDPTGNRTSSVDKLGRVTTYVYDALNRLTGTTFPDVVRKKGKGSKKGARKGSERGHERGQKGVS